MNEEQPTIKPKPTNKFEALSAALVQVKQMEVEQRQKEMQLRQRELDQKEASDQRQFELMKMLMDTRQKKK